MSVPKAGALAKASDWTTVFPLDTDAWTPYTPAWTSSGTAPVLGNASNSSGYTRVGRLIVGRISLTFGSTTTYGTGVYSFSLPATVTGAAVATVPGWCECIDSSASVRALRAAFISAPTLISPIDTAGVQIGATVPFTWAVGDRFTAAFYYESTT